MTQIFDSRIRTNSSVGVIDLDHYEATGGLETALARHANEAYNELSGGAQQRIAEVMFKRLTELGPDGREVRRPTSIAELAKVTGATPEQLSHVIETFRARGRSFLHTSEDQVVDISHESLIRQWPRLREWTQQESESREIYGRLADSADRHERGQAALLRDPDLNIVTTWWKTNRPNQAWADRYAPAFDEAKNFLQQSQAAARRRRMWATAGVVALIALTAASVLLSIAANNSQNDAENQAQIARTQTAAAVDSRDDAEAQRAEAQRQEAEAERQRGEAELQTNRAESALLDSEAAQREAEAQARFAKASADEANEARREAQSAQGEAENQRNEADTQRLRADAERREAETQRELADRSAASARAAQADSEAAQAEIVVVLEKVATDLVDSTCSGEVCIGSPSSTTTFPQQETCGVPPLNSRLEDLGVGFQLQWQNPLTDSVTVYWVSPQGTRIKWAIVEPGGFGSLQTIAGWVWVLEDSSGTCQMIIGP